MQAEIEHVILNREFGEVRTVVVLGVGRGGTSLIAGCLRGLGICMGVTAHAFKHEWSPVVYRSNDSIDLSATRLVIAEMNREHERWGWKSPRDVFHLEQLVASLRDPGFIFVTRDILGASLSGLRYQALPLYIALDDTAFVYRTITSKLRLCPWPTLVIPFAEALQHPQPLVDLLCSFMGITPEVSAKERAINFVRPGRNAYRYFDAKPEDPPLGIPSEDLRTDFEVLAADLSRRHATEYWQQFETALTEAKELIARIGSHFSRLGKVERELCEGLCKLLSALPEDNPATAGDDTLQYAFSTDTTSNFRAMLDSVLQRLVASANEAKQRIQKRMVDSGYDDLTRLYRITQVMIRVRYLLHQALLATDLPPATPAFESRGMMRAFATGIAARLQPRPH